MSTEDMADMLAAEASLCPLVNQAVTVADEMHLDSCPACAAAQERVEAKFAELRAARTACRQACSAYQHVSRDKAYIGRVADLARLGKTWDQAMTRYITARAAVTTS